MDWQPIETAPIDGTKVDIWSSYGSDGERFADACFLRGAWRFWSLDAFDGQSWEKIDGKPTHWMPLPKPPKD